MDRVRLYKILLHRFAPTERQRRFLMQFGVSLLSLMVLLGHVGGLYNFKWIDKIDAARHDFWVDWFALDTIRFLHPGERGQLQIEGGNPRRVRGRVG